MARNPDENSPSDSNGANGHGATDDVDDMLNSLEVSRPRPRRRRGPEFTPAPEAIARARAKEDNSTPKLPKPGGAGTVPMTGAPSLPPDAIHAKIATDPVERAFLNRTEEVAPPRRPDVTTMPTDPKSGGGYLAAAGIAFGVVLVAGLVAWRLMLVVAAQGPAPAAPIESAVATPAVTSPTTSSAITTSATSTVGTVADTSAKPSASIAAPPIDSALASGSPANRPVSTGSAAPHATSKPSGARPSSTAKPPDSKFGNLVAPEL